MIKIFIADESIREGQIKALQNQLPANWEFTTELNDATAIITSNVDITDDSLRKTGSSLKVIIKIQPGKAEIANASIPVHTIYDTGVTSVAEHTMTLILMLGRQMLYAADKTKKQEWAVGKETPILTDQRKYTYNWINLPQSGQLHGKKVGIVGFGFIGQDLAKRLNAFNAKVLYYDLYRKSLEIEKKYNASYVSLEQLLQESDFVSLHLRFAEGENGNEKMFNKDKFALMKPSAYFINTSRGRMVDEADLAEAIKNKKIAGAGLDVFEFEPLKPDCPLLPLAGHNVILTPHIAGTYMEEAWEQSSREIVDIIKEALGV